jgi:hypothetical protein
VSSSEHVIRSVSSGTERKMRSVETWVFIVGPEPETDPFGSRRCEFCRRPLPAGSTKRRRFDTDRCRVLAWRHREHNLIYVERQTWDRWEAAARLVGLPTTSWLEAALDDYVERVLRLEPAAA